MLKWMDRFGEWWVRWSAPKYKLTLEFPADVKQRLEFLQIRSGLPSISEVSRRALAVYELAIVERQKGGTLFIRTADGQDRPVRL